MRIEAHDLGTVPQGEAERVYSSSSIELLHSSNGRKGDAKSCGFAIQRGESEERREEIQFPRLRR